MSVGGTPGKRMTIDPLPPMADNPSCDAYLSVLDDVVADEVDTVTLARFESHLAGCPNCRFALAQARTYRRLMRRVGAGMRAPSSLRERAVDLLRAPRGPQP